MQSASLTLSFVRKSIAIPKLEVESIKDCMVVVGHKQYRKRIEKSEKRKQTKVEKEEETEEKGME